MRDQEFVAEHRGGRLSRHEHEALMTWSCLCVRHISSLFDFHEVLWQAIETGEAWILHEASVGDARNAAVKVLVLARTLESMPNILFARAVGHAVATAHMADHALIAAQYALKALKASGGDDELERIWQNNQLPSSIQTLVLSSRK